MSPVAGFVTANVLPFGAAVNTPSINALVCSRVVSFKESEADMIEISKNKVRRRPYSKKPLGRYCLDMSCSQQIRWQTYGIQVL
jgi:hypothetical protein